MEALIPIFDGSYSGQMIYNNTNFKIGEDFEKYVDSMEIVYDSIFDRKLTGFDDTKYVLNPVSVIRLTATISITLVGDLPTWLMQQLTQLAKACLGGGMTLYFTDVNITYDSYFCKWENAGDFVENNAVLSGGSMLLKVYNILGYHSIYVLDGLGDIYEFPSGDEFGFSHRFRG